MLSECQRLSFCYDSVLHVLIKRITDPRRCKSQALSAKCWVKMACCHSWILTQELTFSFFSFFDYFFFFSPEFKVDSILVFLCKHGKLLPVRETLPLKGLMIWPHHKMFLLHLQYFAFFPTCPAEPMDRADNQLVLKDPNTGKGRSLQG